MAIHLRSAEELEKMHRAGLVVHEVLQALRKIVRPGITTMDLEKFAEEQIGGKPGKPAFKGYYDYPCVLCTSINEEIVHGIPSEKRVLKGFVKNGVVHLLEGELPENCFVRVTPE